MNGLLINTIESMGKCCDTLAVQCNISSVCWNYNWLEIYTCHYKTKKSF